MTINDCILFGENKLKKSGIDSYHYDSQELLSYCLGLPRLELLINKEKEIDCAIYTKYVELIALRSQRIPLQHITHQSNFYGLDLYVDQNVLIPRFETELLCERAINLIGNKTLSVLDLCTGSGCIAIAIAKHCPNASVCAIDVSQEAINIAKKNALKNGVSVNFIKNDLLNNIEQNFDIIISNPPYISSEDMKNLQEEVKHDPVLALDGGLEGLEIIKRIIYSENIRSGTVLMMEIGHAQASYVSTMMSGLYKEITIIKDYCNVDRFIIAKKGD